MYESESMKDIFTNSIQLVEDDIEGLNDLQETREREMDLYAITSNSSPSI